MERALCPDCFEIMPNNSSSENEFNHWLKILKNFLAILPLDNLDKLKVIINHLSPTIYKYIGDNTTYEMAVERLKHITRL